MSSNHGQRNPLVSDASVFMACGSPPNRADTKLCLFAAFCPCWAFGRNAKLALHQNPWIHALGYVGVWLLMPAALIAARIAVDSTFAKCIYRCNMDAIAKADDFDDSSFSDIVDAATAALDTCRNSCHLPVHDGWLTVVSFIYYSMWCVWLLAAMYCASMRTTLRAALGAPGTHARDFALWCCCPAFALCQETRAVHHRFRGNEHKAFVADIENELAPLMDEDRQDVTLPLISTGHYHQDNTSSLPEDERAPRVLNLNRMDGGHL